MKHFKHELWQSAKTLILAGALFAGASVVYAWTGPTQAPPGGNTPPPVNVGSATQVKSGSLGVAEFTANSVTVGTIANALAITSPKYCIGTDCITAWPSGGGTVPTVGDWVDVTGSLAVNPNCEYKFIVTPPLVGINPGPGTALYSVYVVPDINAPTGSVIAYVAGGPGGPPANYCLQNGINGGISNGSTLWCVDYDSQSNANVYGRTYQRCPGGGGETVPSGTWCGIGGDMTILCQGLNPAVSCPSGFVRSPILLGIAGGESYACIKQ